MPLQISCWNAHVDGDLDDLLPVGYCVLPLLLSGAGPAVNNDEGRDLNTCVLQSLAVLRLTLLGEQRVFVEGIDPGVGGLLDIFVAPVRHLVDHILDAHLFRENIYVKSNFHKNYLSFKLFRYRTVCFMFLLYMNQPTVSLSECGKRCFFFALTVLFSVQVYSSYDRVVTQSRSLSQLSQYLAT